MIAGVGPWNRRRTPAGVLVTYCVVATIAGGCSLDLSGTLSPSNDDGWEVRAVVPQRSNGGLPEGGSRRLDAGPDAGNMDPVDAASDAPVDTAVDAPVDASVDSLDATPTPDASVDAEADASKDAATDPVHDAEADADTEADADAAVDTDSGATNPCEGVDCSHLDVACGEGFCHEPTGLCRRRWLPEGTECGEAAGACMLGGTCDGVGHCLGAGPAPAGTPCAEGEVARDCRGDSACDGAGACVAPLEPDGTPCGDCAGGDCTVCASGVCESAGCTDQGTDAVGTRLCVASAADLPCPDIRKSGTAMKLGDDTVNLLLVLGFDFAIYGKSVTGISVHADGVLRLGWEATALGPPGALTDYAGDLPMVAAYWDDLIGTPEGVGEVYWEQQGGPGERTLVVQWASTRKGHGDVDVRAVLHSESHVIELCYVDTDVGDPAFDSGASAAVGIVNAGGSEIFGHSFAEPAVPSGTYLRYEPTAVLFEGFEYIDSLRDVEGWEFPFSSAPFETTTADAASGLYALDHSGLGTGGFATYQLPTTYTSGVIRLEADVKMDDDGVASIIQLALVAPGTGIALNRRRVALTFEPDETTLYAGSTTTRVDQVLDADAWHHVVLEVDLDTRWARAIYDGEELASQRTNFTAFDAIKLIFGPNDGVMRLDNLLVTHVP